MTEQNWYSNTNVGTYNTITSGNILIGSPNANDASISGTILNLNPLIDTNYQGIIVTGPQTISGTMTYSNSTYPDIAITGSQTISGNMTYSTFPDIAITGSQTISGNKDVYNAICIGTPINEDVVIGKYDLKALFDKVEKQQQMIDAMWNREGMPGYDHLTAKWEETDNKDIFEAL